MLVIFDLDGTLLDTVADLAGSTNYALASCHFPTHPAEAYKFFVGNGINKLFERALPAEARTQENILRVRAAFLAYYDQHKTDFTKPYQGIPRVLHSLRQQHVQLAVASNKYQAATAALVRHCFPDVDFAVVFGQREGVPTKPDPRVVHDILAQTGCSLAETVFVGDSAVDMQTAHNAKCTSVGVTWGFRPRTELAAEQPDYMVDTADELLDVLQAALYKQQQNGNY